MSGWGAIYNNSTYAFGRQSELLAKLQEQAASGVRILRPSDSPVEAGRILDLQSQSRSLQTYLDNVSSVVRDLEHASSMTDEISHSLNRVRVLLTQGASGTYSDSNRQSMAGEVNSLLEQVVSLANAANLGRYVFAGTNTSTTPYSVTYSDGKITSVSYQGSQQELMVPVGDQMRRSGTMVGDEIFRSDSRSQPIFLGTTGAAAAAGTSNVHGDVWLAVTHDSTTYGGASGIAAGTSSTAGDTVIGSGHSLAVDDVAGTLSLDGGPAVSFAGAETDLAVQSSSGDVVYVDVTGVAGGFQGSVSITATGKLSIDDGATTTAIAFAANDSVVDSRTGRVLYVDTTAIQRTGAEPVRVPGTYDMFATLIEIRDMLNNERGLPEGKQMELLGEMLESIDEAFAGVTQGAGVLGSRLAASDSLQFTLSNLMDSANRQTAELQDADIVQVATDIARTQTFYEMSLATASRLLTMSLLDFIR